MVIILGMIQVAKKIPFEDPNVLNMARAGYVLSNLIILGISLYIMSCINKKKGAHLSPLPRSFSHIPRAHRKQAGHG